MHHHTPRPVASPATTSAPRPRHGPPRRSGWALAALLLLIPSTAWADFDFTALNDDFSGSWKSCFWEGYQRYGGDTYREGEASYDANLNTVRNNRLDLKVPANYLAGMSWETGLKSKYEIRGDFDIQVDFYIPETEYWTNLDMRGTNVLFIELMAGDAGARRRQVRNSQFNPNTTQAVFNPHLWVANHNNDRVTQIDTDNAVILGTYPVGDSPSRTSVDLIGDVWVNQRCDSSIWRIRASECSPPSCSEAQVNASHKDRYITQYSNGQCNGGGAAVDKNNDPWIGFLNARRVVKLDRGTGQIVEDVPAGGRVYGLAVDVNDYIWSDNHWDGNIDKIDALTGTRLATYRPNDGQCFAPYGIAVDSFGKIWNAHWGNCPYLTRFDPITETFDRFTAPDGNGTLYYNRGVAADNQGLIWTVSSNRSRLSVWDMSTGAFKARYSTCGSPSGVALDRNNRIWVTCINGWVYQHDRDGSVLKQLNMGMGSYSYSDMTGYQLRNFGSEAWKESFTVQSTTSSDTYYTSSITNNYGGGIEDGIGTAQTFDPSLSPVENLQRYGTSQNYALKRISFSDYHYTDRLFRILAHPGELENMWGIATPDDDREVSAAQVFSVDAREEVDVWIAYDAKISSPPSWMDDYAPVPNKQVTSTNPTSPKYNLYKKTVPAGQTIMFGGNRGINGNTSNKRSCAAIKSSNPLAPSGTYQVDTGTGGPISVYCDMDSDGGVGHTIVRINNSALGTDQTSYRNVCAQYGMEVIVPRSRSHAEAIKRYNGGQPPNLVNVFPKSNGAAGLENWEGRCQGKPCSFFLSPERSANCGQPSLEPNGDNSTAYSLYRWSGNDLGCGFGRWNDGHNTVGPDATTRGWVICSTNDVELPVAQTCSEYAQRGTIYNAGPDGVSGVYPLESFNGQRFDAYCHMQIAADGRDRGWTLTMKANGNNTTFSYDSANWTNGNTYNSNAPNLDKTEAKLSSFLYTPFDEIMVGMADPSSAGRLSDYRFDTMPVSGSSMQSVINGGYRYVGDPSRDAWKSLVPNSSLQPNCNQRGINVGNGYSRVRVGIVANQENDCNSPDSRIGIGGQGGACGQNNNRSVGNTATCSADNGNRDISRLGALFVGELPARLVGHWRFDGNALDSSGRNHHGAFFNGAQATGTPGVSGVTNIDKAATFDGVDSYFRVPHHNDLAPGSISLAFWMRIPERVDLNGNNNWRSLLNKSNSDCCTGAGYDLVLEEWGNHSIAFDTAHASGSDRWWPSRVQIPVNEWTHVAFVYNAANGIKYAFFNGRLVDTKVVGRGPIDYKGRSDELRISSANNPAGGGSGSYKGNIDDLRIYDGPLSENHIRTIAGRGFNNAIGNYFVYFQPTRFTTQPPSPNRYTIIHDPAHKSLEPGGTLRVKRVGSTWSFYYIDRGSGADFNGGRTWLDMGSLDLGTQDVSMRLRSRMDPFWHSGPTNNPGGPLSLQFDNYRVNHADGIVGAPTETCNGIDDDCDGRVDETFPGEGDPCSTGLPGLCGTGVLACQNSQTFCRQVNSPSPEVCDAIDNDCNGIIDDYVTGGQTAGGQTVSVNQSCTDPTQQGPCSAGQYICDKNSGDMVCASVVTPKPDVCDGIDNDCDGEVDNDVDSIFKRVGYFTQSSQRSRPIAWPRPATSNLPFFTDNGDPNDDFLQIDPAQETSLATVNALRKGRVILYLDPTLADGQDPEGKYIVLLAHGATEPAQQAATATYAIRHKLNQPLGVIYSTPGSASLAAGGGDKYQKFVVTSEAGKAGVIALGPLRSKDKWNLDISATFSGDVTDWEMYNAETNTGIAITTQEILNLRNNTYPNSLNQITADTGQPCTVAGQLGICRQGTGGACTQDPNTGAWAVACNQTVVPQPETCDTLDNNCNGIVDGSDEIVYAMMEVRQSSNDDLKDWTLIHTINSAKAPHEYMNFQPRNGDPNIGSPDFRDLADPTQSPQRINRSLMFFHRDTRAERGALSMGLIHGKLESGLDGALSPSTEIVMELQGYQNEAFTSLFDDRASQEGDPADAVPDKYTPGTMEMKWTLSRWNQGLNFTREADGVMVYDVAEDRFLGTGDQKYKLKFKDSGNLTDWIIYQPFRDNIALNLDKDVELRSRNVRGTDAICLIDEHPLPRCIGAPSELVCVNGQVLCQTDPTGCCLDEDGDGYFGYDATYCAKGNDCDDTNKDVHPDAEEICDGIDNNCGGCAAYDNKGKCTQTCDFRDPACATIDETFPQLGLECEDAANGVFNQGVCKAEVTCANGQLSCQQLQKGGPEICDGLDNDCDGIIDGTRQSSGREVGTEECNFEFNCFCEDGKTGSDSCSCIIGLTEGDTTQRTCPDNSIATTDGKCVKACQRDGDCKDGEACERDSGLCVARAGGVPKGPIATNGVVLSASPSGELPVGLGLCGFALLGGLIGWRRRRAA